MQDIDKKTNEARNREIEDLILKISRGESEALGRLYKLIGKDVYVYALSKSLDGDAAEDVTHDTFILLWKKAKLYKMQGMPMPWIFTLEMNVIRHRYRGVIKTVSLDEALSTSSDIYDPSELIYSRELAGRLLRLLSGEERKILSLYLFEGLRHKEIAAILKKPVPTVISKYNRAIKKLRREISKYK